MKKIFSLFLFLVVSNLSFADNSNLQLVKIEIFPQHKNVTLLPGDFFQFQAIGLRDDGHVDPTYRPRWKVTDINGFETTIPGIIDQNGLFRATTTYYGPFKVIAYDEETKLSDEANVVIANQGGPVAYIRISPDYLTTSRGMSHFLWVTCYDRNSQAMPTCYLSVNVFDVFGFLRNNVATMTNDSYIHINPWAQQGSYRVRFRDYYGTAWADLQLNIY